LTSILVYNSDNYSGLQRYIIKYNPKHFNDASPIVFAFVSIRGFPFRELDFLGYARRVKIGPMDSSVAPGNTKGGKYYCTIDLLFDWFGLVCFANKNKNCQLSYS
jgi:hypothetical protein